MPKFEVFIHYEGCMSYIVDANNEDEAETKAWRKYDNETADTLYDALGDPEICDIIQKL